ncbi:MAG: D-amino acid dehydrogenase [Pseudomonadota bacterium]
MKVVIIGAGIIGATTALVLTERGFDVTLLEAEPEAGMGTSYANGSSITPVHAEPWNPPGISRSLPSALFNRRSPIRIALSALPGLLAWGRRFLRESEPERYLANTRHCIRLALYSRRSLVGLRERHALSYDQWTEGSMELYRSTETLNNIVNLRHQLELTGVEFEELNRDEIVAREPALQPVADDFSAALWLPSHESGDARRFSAEAVRRARQLGATVKFQTRVTGIKPGVSPSVSTSKGRLSADRIILCTGTGTESLLSPFRLRVPIYPVQGYSLTVSIKPQSPAPWVPLLDAERRFVIARLGPARLRIAGLAEFSGWRRRLDPKRLDLLRDSAEALLPGMVDDIRAESVEPWTGLRPMTPDGPPLIGATPLEGIWLNAGHGAMGWTQAAGSAELLADLLTGNPTAIEINGLNADRVFGEFVANQ